MKNLELLLANNYELRQLLDVYLELRLHFQEMGFNESDTEDPPYITPKMINLRENFQHRLIILLNYVNDYGFDINKKELVEYIKPLLIKLNEITPLQNGNNKRDDTGDEDN